MELVEALGSLTHINYLYQPIQMIIYYACVCTWTDLPVCS